jgi:hypothetical protein
LAAGGLLGAAGGELEAAGGGALSGEGGVGGPLAGACGALAAAGDLGGLTGASGPAAGPDGPVGDPAGSANGAGGPPGVAAGGEPPDRDPSGGEVDGVDMGPLGSGAGSLPAAGVTGVAEPAGGFGFGRTDATPRDGPVAGRTTSAGGGAEGRAVDAGRTADEGRCGAAGAGRAAAGGTRCPSAAGDVRSAASAGPVWGAEPSARDAAGADTGRADGGGTLARPTGAALGGTTTLGCGLTTELSDSDTAPEASSWSSSGPYCEPCLPTGPSSCVSTDLRDTTCYRAASGRHQHQLT